MMQEKKFKYGRTYHLEFSQGIQSDDKKLRSSAKLQGQEVVATLKLDGENTSLYASGYMHARSIDSTSNWTRDIVKKIQSVVHHDIPEGWRLCCENVYAKHSIFYPDNYLEGYLYLLSIWNDQNVCLSWDDTVAWAQLLDLPQPKVLYRGVWDEAVLKKLAANLDTSIEEGFVVRTTRSVGFDEFSECFTKFVRKGHVQEDAEHWLKNTYPNGAPRKPGKPGWLGEITNTGHSGALIQAGAKKHGR